MKQVDKIHRLHPETPSFSQANPKVRPTSLIAPIEELLRWGEVAGMLGISRSMMIRCVLNQFCDMITSCSHPLEARIVTPSDAEYCQICGLRVVESPASVSLGPLGD